jgi:hypothetical protein
VLESFAALIMMAASTTTIESLDGSILWVLQGWYCVPLPITT